MEISFEPGIVAFNLVLFAVIAAVPIIGLIATRRATSGVYRAHAYSVRAKLPFGSEATGRRVAARLRAQIRANLWALLGVIAVTAPLLLIPGFATSPQLLWVVAVTLLVCGLSAAAVAVNLRAQLFEVAPDAPRVAHLRDLTVRDYLQPWRRLPAPLLLAAAAAVVLLFGAGEAIGLWHAPMSTRAAVYITMGGALIIALGTRIAEARVLAQPRRAHDELELAWNDIFRSEALGALRMSLAIAAWLPLGIAGSFLFFDALTPADPTSLTILEQFPWWGVATLQVIYTLGAGTMPSAIYPPGLDPRAPRHAIPVGGAA